MKRKILYLSWSFPPNFGGSAYITYELGKNFSAEEMVIVTGSRLFQKNINPYNSEYLPKVYYIISEFNISGHGDRYFSFLRNMVYFFLKRKLHRIIESEKVTDIIITFPDEYYLKLGIQAAKKYNLKIYTYFHNTFVENRSGADKEKAIQLQECAFSNSRTIFAMSDGLTAFYKDKYPLYAEKFETLPHTFERYLPITPPPNNDNFKFALIGTFNYSNIEATLRILNVLKNMKNIEVHIYTSVNEIILERKWKLKIEDNIYYHKAVHQDQVHSVLQNYNACILTHGFSGGYSDIEYKTIFPTRTIPLLISGRPFIAHSPENSFLTDFLTMNKCCLLVKDRNNVIIEQQISSFIKDNNFQKNLVIEAIKCSEYFLGRNVAKRLKDILG